MNWNLSELDFLKLKEYYPFEANYLFWKDIYVKQERHTRTDGYQHIYFSGAGEVRNYTSSIDNPARHTYFPKIKLQVLPFIVEVAIFNELKRIIRECENTSREERKLPKVGEGWISETYLFYKLCKAFPSEKIVQHGRPAWLGKQHLDVFFSKRNIGVEYQGKQHLEPVNYFGGISSFEKLIRLDIKKRELCFENACFLIYVNEGYNIDEIVAQIENRINELETN